MQKNVIKYEIDDKDIFGAILFDMQDSIIASFPPGQAAYGAPYWDDFDFSIKGLPKVEYAKGIEIIGPYPPPRNGQSGWFMIRKYLTSDLNGNNYSGSIALHIRLASLTEQLSNISSSVRYKTVLMTPKNQLFSCIGSPPLKITKDLIPPGPEIVKGWFPA